MGDETRITRTQCVTARAHLGWSQDRLAQESCLSKGTIAEFEVGKRTPVRAHMDKIVEALERGGAVWVPGREGEYEATASRRWGMPEPRKRARAPREGGERPTEIEAMAACWQARPDLREALSEDSRQAVEAHIYGKVPAEEVEETAEEETACSESPCSQSST